MRTYVYFNKIRARRIRSEEPCFAMFPSGFTLRVPCVSRRIDRRALFEVFKRLYAPVNHCVFAEIIVYFIKTPQNPLVSA